MENAEITISADTVAEDRARCDQAFLVEAVKVGPFLLQPLTLDRWCVLRHAGSPFILGGSATRSDLAKYMWLCSADFVTASALKQPEADAMAKSVIAKTVDTLESMSDQEVHEMSGQVSAYVDEVFEHAVKSRDSKRTAELFNDVSIEAIIIHDLASAYGWSAKHIRSELPLAQIFQLQRCIIRTAIGDKEYRLQFSRMTKALDGVGAQLKKLRLSKEQKS